MQDPNADIMHRHCEECILNLCTEKYIDKEDINKGWKFCQKLIFANISNAWNLELEFSGIRSRSWKEVPKDSNDHWILLTILIYAFWYFCLLLMYRLYYTTGYAVFIISSTSMYLEALVSLMNVLCFCVFINRDTAGQERFRTITTAYYRGAMVWWHCFQFLGSFSVDFSRSSFAWGV